MPAYDSLNPTDLLQLPNKVIADAQHYYIHVSGNPKSGLAIFASSTDNKRKGDVSFKFSGHNPGY